MRRSERIYYAARIHEVTGLPIHDIRHNLSKAIGNQYHALWWEWFDDRRRLADQPVILPDGKGGCKVEHRFDRIQIIRRGAGRDDSVTL